jgi:hypothetical protein
LLGRVAMGRTLATLTSVPPTPRLLEARDRASNAPAHRGRPSSPRSRLESPRARVSFGRLDTAVEEQRDQLHAPPPARPSKRRALEQSVAHIESRAGVEGGSGDADAIVRGEMLARAGDAVQNRQPRPRKDCRSTRCRSVACAQATRKDDLLEARTIIYWNRLQRYVSRTGTPLALVPPNRTLSVIIDGDRSTQVR